MKTSGKKTSTPHWRNRRRYIAHRRMEWYGETGDERYWHDYWKARLTADYYCAAEHAALEQDELGQILLAYLATEGLHLEAGCGAGYWVAALRQRGLRIEGIE